MALPLLAATALAAALGAVTMAQVRGMARRVRADADRIGDGEAVFPLGYLVDAEGRPDARYRERLDLTAAIWQRHRTPIWSLAGQLAGMKRTTAEYTRRYLVERGVDADAVRIIDEFPFLGESVETIQEVLAARAVAERAGVRRLVIVSDLLHLAQIRLVVAATDLDPIFVSTSLTPQWTVDHVRYVAVRLGVIPLTVVDRRGACLGWLRAWRSGRLGLTKREAERIA